MILPLLTVSTQILIKRAMLVACSVFILFAAPGNSIYAVNRISVSSGNFSNSAIWNPAGIPGSGDELTIQNGHEINVDANCATAGLTVANGGKLTFTPTKKLSIHGDFTVYGIAEIINGDVDLVNQGAAFAIGATGSVIWSPANNTVSGATLFTNGNEFFHPASTLNIKKWYDYSNVPLGSVVTGNFGNLILNTLTNGLLYEWNQDNEFENHVILGTLTIEQGWIVLDKSGSIAATTIGSIYLKNINSYLDIHSGNHPGTFSLTTASITNIGGKLNGIYNGEGNIQLQVNGDFTNLGNVVLIYNSGIQGIGNGNANLKITGKFLQTSGDFRGIFNISSTTSGKADLELNDVELTGGIFMGQYSCHTAGNNSVLKINGDLNINFTSANSKFRGNGLTTLSGTNNNLSMQLTIEGNLTVKGNPSAEFTSSGSTGPETTTIKGISEFSGCNSNFNFGNHATTLHFYENLDVNGGVVYLSRTNGTLTVLLQKNLNIQSGNISITGGTGNCNMIINGDYYQTGGSLFFHNNNSVPTPNIIYTTIHGNFLNYSGHLTFDNNSATAVQHRLSANGEMFAVGGNAIINSTTTTANPVYGIIYFDRLGEMEYSQNGTTPVLQYVQQIINTGCTLKIINGNMQVAEAVHPFSSMLLVSGNSVLDIGDHQIYGNTPNLYTSVFVDAGGRLRLSGEQGLYNGSNSAAIMSSGNMLYTLDEASIVEYYGSKAQIITGIGLGNASTTGQQYGFLEINKPRQSASLNSNMVTVRSGIILNDGELDLNGFNLILQSGFPSAITTNGGYIKSESNYYGSNSMIKWKNIAPGTHIIPFGLSPSKLIPFSFTPISGLGNDFAISTRQTGSDNRPLTNGVMHLNYNGGEAGSKRVIDRWYHIIAPGIKANITCSYLGEENTVDEEYALKNFGIINWTGIHWKMLGGNGNGTVSSAGSVSVNSVSSWGALLIASNEGPQPADILSFNAALDNRIVKTSWIAVAGISTEKYTVQRSSDSFEFEDLFEKTAQPQSASPITYNGTDEQPLSGTSWYRLKQHDFDGSLKYSQAVRIENSNSTQSGIEILNVSPNPFSSGFTANYQVPETGDVEIKLTGSNGQIVHKQFVQNSEGKNMFVFSDGGNLNPGLYILTISNGRSSKNYKLFHI